MRDGRGRDSEATWSRGPPPPPRPAPRSRGRRSGTHDAQAPRVPRAARGRGRARRGALLSRGMITEEILEPTARGL